MRHVVVLASDSLLTAPTVERLLAQRRLAEDQHTDALLPGEAAAAVMLTRTTVHTATRTAPEVWITGAAHGLDDWRLDGDTPLRAQALTAVLREAARRSGIAVADAEFHASGMNGEHWMAREIDLALSRAMERKRTHFPHHRIAQFIGDTGTAGALATLAWITHEMRVDRQAGQNGTRRIGRIGLLHFSEDDGQRSAFDAVRPRTRPRTRLRTRPRHRLRAVHACHPRLRQRPGDCQQSGRHRPAPHRTRAGARRDRPLARW